jgi:hypothetical protein
MGPFIGVHCSQDLLMYARIIYGLIGLHLVFGCVPAPGTSTFADEEADAAGAADAADAADTPDVGGTEPLPEQPTALEGWSWVEVEGTSCGNGTPTGMGINPAPGAKRVVMMLAGGGACWDGASCYVFNGAANIESRYDRLKFEADARAFASNRLLDRDRGLFAHAHLVFIPYCTGDFHAGDAIGSYDAFNPARKVHHKGAVNMAAYLREMQTRFGDLEEIYAVGFSAGGYGAMLNLGRIKQAFPGAQVHVLADSAPMVQALEGRWGMWQRAWNLGLPDECEGCTQRFPDLAEYIVASHRDGRIGLLAYEDDAVVAVYFAHALDAIGSATRALVRDVYDVEHARAFVVPGAEHVMLGGYETIRDAEGRRLSEFVRAWATGQDW